MEVFCPCGFARPIPEELARCPVCGSDLAPLVRIRRLREQLAALASRRRKGASERRDGNAGSGGKSR